MSLQTSNIVLSNIALVEMKSAMLKGEDECMFISDGWIPKSKKDSLICVESEKSF